MQLEVIKRIDFCLSEQQRITDKSTFQVLLTEMKLNLLQRNYLIMDFLREIVSGPKNRYREDGYNLDLTYVTPRIVAMAYPAEGLEKLYRNSIDTVSELLSKNHEGNYQIINVSGREINSDKLSNIHSFYWEDHKTPEFQTLFIICQIMVEHLSKSPKNVCVVHCNHGKGRTGTLICCFMLFTGYFQTAAETMKFYEKQRFEKEGYGVTQPCQIKYIEYFSQIIKRPTTLPMVLSLSKIQILGSHHLRDPYFKLRGVEHNDYYMSTKDEHMDILEIQKESELSIKIRKQSYFIGDCVLQIKHNPVVGRKVAATYAFNTAFFMTSIKNIEVGLSELSPLSSVKSGIFEKDFKLRLSFKKICHCPQFLEYSKRCGRCQPYLLVEKKKWEIIYQILDRKPKLSGEWLLFGSVEKEEKASRQSK